MRPIALIAAGTLLLGGGTAAAATTTSAQQGGGNSGPPPLVLLTDPPVDIGDGMGCWTEGNVTRCADGIPPRTRDLPVVRADQVDVAFEVPDTVFTASLDPLPRRGCRHTYSAEVTDHGDGTWTLTPQAPAGRYRVSLAGAAEQGEVWGDFVWRTSTDTAPAPASATISIITKAHGKLRAWGYNLHVARLALTPTKAVARITATAANGHSYTFFARHPSLGCPASGSLTLWEHSPYRKSHRVLRLGPAPFRYDVRLALDGTRYRASATWPDDHVDDPFNSNPAPVPLTFDPPLPVG